MVQEVATRDLNWPFFFYHEIPPYAAVKMAGCQFLKPVISLLKVKKLGGRPVYVVAPANVKAIRGMAGRTSEHQPELLRYIWEYLVKDVSLESWCHYL